MTNKELAGDVAVSLLSGFLLLIICVGLGVAFPPSLAADTDAPARLVYVPRCAPAFAGRALVCVDDPVARTVEVLP